MKNLPRAIALLAVLASTSSCTLMRICSDRNPCDARPASYIRAERAEERRLKKETAALKRDGTLYVFYVGGPFPLAFFVVKDGRLVPVAGRR